MSHGQGGGECEHFAEEGCSIFHQHEQEEQGEANGDHGGEEEDTLPAHVEWFRATRQSQRFISTIESS